MSLSFLKKGSVSKDPGYYVDESGRVIYTDSREKVGDSGVSERNPGFLPLFPGSQRIYPAGENSDLRESYITRAPIEAIQVILHGLPRTRSAGIRK